MLYWIFDLDDTLYQVKPTNKTVYNDLYLDYSFLKPDNKLEKLLKHLSGYRIIMTNSVHQHCRMVLDKLNITTCFNDIFDRNIVKQLKPHPITYIFLIKKLKIKKEDVCFFFDDSPVNLIMAKKFGWKTILITPNPWQYYEGHQSIDFVFPNIHSAIIFFIKKMYKII